MAIEVHLVPALQDNYIFLVRDVASGATAAVDPGEAPPVIAALASRGWGLDAIWLTHHHADHIAGVEPLLESFPNCRVVGAHLDRHRLPRLSQTVREGDQLSLGPSHAQVWEIPGHTIGHLAYYFPEDQLLFCGDTLFGLGCGRLFEGSAEQMWQSLERLTQLPPATRIFCAHEYTQANSRFALTIEAANVLLQLRIKNINEQRRLGQPTVPLILEDELNTNPFLRPHSPAIRNQVGMAQAPLWQVFGEIRRRKDHFKG